MQGWDIEKKMIFIKFIKGEVLNQNYHVVEAIGMLWMFRFLELMLHPHAPSLSLSLSLMQSPFPFYGYYSQTWIEFS